MTLRVLQHLYSSVDRGYNPSRGRGFQTVAVSPELVGTEDLALLEKASFYAVSRERRQAGPPPVKEVFFGLPSGRYAVGRTVDWGTDSMGREGNYLAHHLVVDGDAFEILGANAFALLDAANAAAPDTDLTPRDLPAVELELPRRELDPVGLERADPGLRASLAVAAAQAEGPPLLLVGEEALSTGLVRAVVDALAPEERPVLHFCTHLYESASLRQLFRLGAVGSRAEIPGPRDGWRIFDLKAGEAPEVRPENAYQEWFGTAFRDGAWEELRAFNRSLVRLREGKGDLPLTAISPPGRVVLWSREGEALLRAVHGNPALSAAFLQDLAAPKRLLKSLLSARPEDLCGARAPSTETETCLRAFRSAVPPRAWRGWVRRWRAEPLVRPFAAEGENWMDRLKQRLPVGKKRG